MNSYLPSNTIIDPPEMSNSLDFGKDTPYTPATEKTKAMHRVFMQKFDISQIYPENLMWTAN